MNRKIFYDYIKSFFVILIALVFNINQCVYGGEEINLAFTIDNNYTIFNAIALHSILNNNVSNSKYNIYIIENNLSPKNKKLLSDFVKSYNQNIQFINVNTDSIDSGTTLYKHYNCTHVTKIGTARILLPLLLPENIDKVLYLDSDILVRSDLKELYDTDLTGYAAAMGADHWVYVSGKFDTEPPPYYCNSGVILINLKYWRDNNITQELINCIANTQLTYPDQDAINIVLGEHIKLLHKNWNNQLYYGNPIDSDTDHGIIHYISQRKPWLYMPFCRYCKNIYLEYWKHTPFHLTRFLFIPKGIAAYYKYFCFYDYRDIQKKIKRYRNEYVDPNELE